MMRGLLTEFMAPNPNCCVPPRYFERFVIGAFGAMLAKLIVLLKALNSAWFQALNISRRSWILVPSFQSGKSLNTEISQFCQAGSRTLNVPESNPWLPTCAGWNTAELMNSYVLPPPLVGSP